MRESGRRGQPLPSVMRCVTLCAFAFCLRPHDDTDYTAAAILEQFGNEATAQSVERIMKVLATAKAKRMLEVRLLRVDM